MYQQRKMASGGKAPKDESGAAADDKYRYLPNYYKVKGNEHFANSSSSTVKCKLPAPPSSLDSNSCSLKWCVVLCQNYIWQYFRDAFNTFLDHILLGAACQAWFPFCPCPVCLCRGDSIHGPGGCTRSQFKHPGWGAGGQITCTSNDWAQGTSIFQIF